MVYHGKVSKGMIVLDGTPALPEGAVVSVEVAMQEPACPPGEESLADEILRVAGTCDDLPPDFALNHDHYIHGQEKR